MRVLYIIKDYDRLKDEYHAILNGGYGTDIVMPSLGTDISKPTEDKAIRLSMISDELHAIEQGLRYIPKEYRQSILQSIKYGAKYPDTAHYNTWRYNKYKFTWHVADILKLT